MNEVFTRCAHANDLLNQSLEDDARNEVIRILDYCSKIKVTYPSYLNHLIRQVGLFPYLDEKEILWEDAFVHNAFQADIGLDEPIALHRAQSEILKKLLNNESIVVSAPTSFGKSFIIDAYIANKKPNNVVIIVPTIALTDETRRRLHYKFSGEYKIITTGSVSLANKNILIFPQERSMGYLKTLKTIDFLVIDEFYKASADYDKERSPALLRAILKFGEIANLKYYLAPNIVNMPENPFTKGMNFIQLKFNTVVMETHNLYVNIGKDEEKKTVELIKLIKESTSKTLIYAGTYKNIDKISQIVTGNIKRVNNSTLQSFSAWLKENYSPNWQLVNLVERGFGVHNGRLHRSLSQIQMNLFDELNGLRGLISTSSIIEGVNTSAESVIVWSNKNGASKLNDFSFKNIKGRSGRMFRHFIGKVYILEKPPEEEQAQLTLDFSDEMWIDLKDNMTTELTKEQLAKLLAYKDEMEAILGADAYKRIQNHESLQTCSSETVMRLASDMIINNSEWNGLGYLNSENVNEWDRILFKILKTCPTGWDGKFSSIVEFIKILANNWVLTIPELLERLELHEIGIDEFFKMERVVTHKLSAILNDVNILCREIKPSENYDISKFIGKVSNAFLPPLVYQLEEYGMPRMISRRIHHGKILNLLDEKIGIHGVIDALNKIGTNALISNVCNGNNFDKYIVECFFKGISVRRK